MRLLEPYIASPALESEVAQLTITLEQAPGEIVSFALRLARRFLELFEQDIANIQTEAAGDAYEIGQLVLRSYAQAEDSAVRTELLDVVDRLLELNAYGFAEAVDTTAR